MIIALSMLSLYMPAPLNEAQTDATTCKVLEAAYTAAVIAPSSAGIADNVYPGTVVAAEHEPSRLETWIPEFRRKTPIDEDEFAEMQRLQPPPALRYKPNCVWSGAPHNYVDSGVTFKTSFSRPIIDPKRELALVEVSFYSPGRFAFGKECVVRKRRGSWAATCLSSWIT